MGDKDEKPRIRTRRPRRLQGSSEGMPTEKTSTESIATAAADQANGATSNESRTTIDVISKSPRRGQKPVLPKDPKANTFKRLSSGSLLGENHQELENLRNQLKEKDAAISTLKSQLQSATQTSDSKETAMKKEWQQAQHATAKQFAELQESLQEVEHSNTTLKEENEELKEERQKLLRYQRKQQVTTALEVSYFQSLKEQSKKALADMQSQLDMTRENYETAQKSLEKLQRKSQESHTLHSMYLQTKLNEAKNLSQEQKSQMSNLYQELDDYKHQSEELQQQLKTVTAHHEKERQASQGEIDDLGQVIENLKSQLTMLDDEKEKSKELQAKAMEDLKQSQREKRGFDSEIQRIVRSGKEREEDLMLEIERWKQKAQAKSNELFQTWDDVDTLTEELDRVCADLEAWKLLAEEKHDELCDVTERAEALEDELERLKEDTKIISMRSAGVADDSRAEVAELQEQLKQLKHENGLLMQLNTKHMAMIETLDENKRVSLDKGNNGGFGFFS